MIISLARLLHILAYSEELESPAWVFNMTRKEFGMLVLTRRVGESLKIGEFEDILEGPVTVTVLEVRGGQVRIGVEAQRNVRIDREEIRQRVDRGTPIAYFERPTGS